MSRAGRPSVRRAKLRAVYVLPSIPDDAPSRFKSALAIRNACAVEGRCPDCGARVELRGPDENGILHLTFEHEAGCAVLLGPEAA